MAPDTLTPQAAALALGDTPAAIFEYRGWVYAYAVDGYVRTPITAKAVYTIADWFTFHDGRNNV